MLQLSKRVQLITLLLLHLCCFSQFALAQVVDTIGQKDLAKFEPPAGSCLVFIGQDLGSVGGLEDYNDGYFDHFPPAAGITTYTNLSPGGESYGYYFRGLDGLKT